MAPVALAILVMGGLALWWLQASGDVTEVPSFAERIPPWVTVTSTLLYAGVMCYAVAHLSQLWPRHRWLQVAAVGVVLAVPVLLSTWGVAGTGASVTLQVVAMTPALLIARYMGARRAWLGLLYAGITVAIVGLTVAMATVPAAVQDVDLMRLGVLGAVVSLLQLGSMGCQLFFALDLTRDW